MLRSRPGRIALGLAIGWAAGAGTADASLQVPAEAHARAALRPGAVLEARLLVHPDDLDRGAAGDPKARVGLLLDPPPGWHLYWRNPGESGLAPELDWQVDGGRIGGVSWPAPTRFWEADGEIETFGYAGRLLLTSEVEFVADAVGPRRARLEADLLVCEHECVPTELSLARALTAAGAHPESAAEERRLFEHFARSVPVAPDALGVSLAALVSSRVAAPGEPVEVALAVEPCSETGTRTVRRQDCQALLPPASGRVFFPDAGGPDLVLAGTRPHPGDARSWLVRFEAPSPPAAAARLRGVLALAGADGALHHVEVDLPLRAADASERALFAAASGSPHGPGLLAALGLGLLGGLLLNLMPCVLPVLAIKVFGVAEMAARSRRELRLHGLAYAAGIGASMLALAALVIGLRQAGAAVGWGFQFQEPLFVAGIAILLVAFASNLFGVFEITAPTGALAGLGAETSGARRSFFEGLLAVVLATPCTAPFLGTAVGFAFAAPAPSIAAIFGAIGAGLAAPYVAVTWVPGWARLVPRSGRWMLRMRTGLGFALLATVVWLVWIFGRSTGSDGAALLLGLLLAVAFAAWVQGILQQREPRRLSQALVPLAALLALLAAAGLPRAEATPVGSARGDGWREYAAPALAARLAAGQPAFVSFTADWCITCKVNERVVLADERVRQEWQRRDFALFRADWTRRDESIRAELARFGRAGVPLYLIYRPGSPDRPMLLPEILSVDRVLEALRAAG
jgi:thiol:disulfide interchange protein DsbD